MEDVAARVQQLQSALITVLLNPASNPKAAFLLFGVIALLLLLVLVVAIMLVMRSPEEGQVPQTQAPVRDEELEQLVAGETFEGREEVRAVGQLEPPSPSNNPKRQPLSASGRLAIAVVVVLLIGAAWAVTGHTTSNPAVCKGCHGAGSEHAKAAKGTDPHAKVPCVSCHESGGRVGRFVTGVPARLLHFAASQSRTPRRGEYGHVTTAACSSCHLKALVGVATDATRGIKVSHKEPLAASATCIDCHRLSAGVVSVHNAGMAPCLRCHNSRQASSECVTCHDEKAASAARARTTSFADVQIAELSCDGCHNLKKECDWCHGGVRLPHSLEFKMHAHARAGAVDFWYNEGKTCSPCHNASKRPCQQCHETLLGQAHGKEPWLSAGHQKATAQACDTCHRRFAYTATRDFCKDVCHTPSAIANSPR